MKTTVTTYPPHLKPTPPAPRNVTISFTVTAEEYRIIRRKASLSTSSSGSISDYIRTKVFK